VDVEIEAHFYHLMCRQLIDVKHKTVFVIIAQHLGLVIGIELASADVVQVGVFEIIEIDLGAAFFS